ncbi:MAG: hypothetical protein IJ730_06395 [Alphaproteobacteria bacterium]|nr:hypothetical protein [Alphaproteobacteria bacterium]
MLLIFLRLRNVVSRSSYKIIRKKCLKITPIKKLTMRNFICFSKNVMRLLKKLSKNMLDENAEFPI